VRRMQHTRAGPGFRAFGSDCKGDEGQLIAGCQL
jgi:hypothetical protein